jgi:hypothetical protein
MIILFFIMLICGSYFAILGFKMLFQSGFVEEREGVQKSEKNGWYFYAKYASGLRYFLSGLLLLGFAAYSLFNLY